MSSKSKNRVDLDERIVVDSADVERATRLAVERNEATVSDIIVDGKVVNEEIFNKMNEL